MADPYIREIGRVEDIDGLPLAVGTDRGMVTIRARGQRLGLVTEQADDLAAMLITALWQAERDAGLIAREALARAAGGEP